MENLEKTHSGCKVHMDIESNPPCSSEENKPERSDDVFVFVYKLNSWLGDLAEIGLSYLRLTERFHFSPPLTLPQLLKAQGKKAHKGGFFFLEKGQR